MRPMANSTSTYASSLLTNGTTIKTISSRKQISNRFYRLVDKRSIYVYGGGTGWGCAVHGPAPTPGIIAASFGLHGKRLEKTSAADRWALAFGEGGDGILTAETFAIAEGRRTYRAHSLGLLLFLRFPLGSSPLLPCPVLELLPVFVRRHPLITEARWVDCSWLAWLLHDDGYLTSRLDEILKKTHVTDF